VPMITPPATTANASGSESLTPYSVRVRTSRPSSSVPSRCAAFGAVRDAPDGAIGL
jgi:hypothetical protein